MTSNATYLTAALESGNFLLSNFQIMSENNGIATLSANASDSCTHDHFGDGAFRVAAVGMFMEGLSYLSPDTVIGSKSVTDL